MERSNESRLRKNGASETWTNRSTPRRAKTRDLGLIRPKPGRRARARSAHTQPDCPGTVLARLFVDPAQFGTALALTVRQRRWRTQP